MIIDLILDRKDYIEIEKIDRYVARLFYKDVKAYGEVGFGILSALESGNENAVKKALHDYLEKQDYNLEIKKFIDSVEWLPKSIEDAEDALLEKRDDLIFELANVIASLSKIDIDFTKIEQSYMFTELSYEVFSFLKSEELFQKEDK